MVSGKKTEIVRLLKEAEGRSVSGEELGEKLGISRTMVWKYIKALEEEGYEIRSSPKIGYSLRSVPDRLYPEEIKAGLETRLIGQDIRYFDEVESTNNVAKEIAHEAKEGTVVIAEVQNKGRGRLGREWESQRGGIWMSVILKPTVSIAHACHLTLVAGVAVAKAMRKLGVDARIKWPNDVLIEGKKVCGILTEVNAEVEQIDYVVIGIGINANINPKDFEEEIRETSTTLMANKGESIDRAAFVRDLLFELEQEYIKFDTQPFPKILEEWISLSDTIGRQVTIMTPTKMIEGKAVGISEKGALIVENAKCEREEVIAGRCLYTRAK